METNHSIKDRHGISYRVESEMGIGWTLYVWHGDTVIGEMLCSFARPVLKIGNLQIYHAVRVPETSVARFWSKLVGRPAPTIDYRTRGLGTAMLQLIEVLAKAKGFTGLQGWISDVDYVPNPRLPAWYRARGYTVITTKGEIGRQVATIHKEL